MPRPLRKQLIQPLLILVVIACGMWVPALLGDIPRAELTAFLVSGLAIALALTGLRLLVPKRVGLRLVTNGLFWLAFVLVYLLRCLWVLVQDFSAEGFTDNFFAHISGEALRVGLEEYAVSSLVVVLLGGIGVLLVRRLGPSVDGSGLPVPAALTVMAVALLAVAPAGPEVQSVKNYQVFRAQINPGSLSSEDRQRLEASGLVNLGGTARSELRATPPKKPQNLILIYLESFHLAFTDNPALPGLTPGIDQLKERHGYHPQWLSSADATMEGLISTLCGTLVASSSGASGFANRKAIVPGLACLPDVLAEAGYYQVYMGGFEKAFTGKETFLSGHGYDEVFGWEDWRAQGLSQEIGRWGLADDLLFEQALNRVRALQSKAHYQPFNLTLLTLGTHPPGLAVSACASYPTGPQDRIVQAIHCTDQLLSQFIDTLQGEGLLDNTLVVITGDHDIFNLPELRTHFPGLATDPRLLHLVIDPRGPVAWPEHVNTGADLPPTLLDLLDIEHNARFMWGRSAFTSRPGFLTRNFRGQGTGPIRFLETRPAACDEVDPTLSGPLDDCAHHELLRLSDQFLYSFYGESAVPAALCDKASELQVVADSASGLSMLAAGAQQEQNFARGGRRIEPSAPGFYLYIKPSRARASAHYYYRLDHVYWQIKLSELLLELEAEDQFVLAYLPGEHSELIAPLAHYLTRVGLVQPDLDRAFVLATNGDPVAGQVYVEHGESVAGLEMNSAQCQRLAEDLSGQPLLERSAIEAQLAPLAAQYPDV